MSNKHYSVISSSISQKELCRVLQQASESMTRTIPGLKQRLIDGHYLKYVAEKMNEDHPGMTQPMLFVFALEIAALMIAEYSETVGPKGSGAPATSTDLDQLDDLISKANRKSESDPGNGAGADDDEQ